jgi:hypothetical protein
MIRGETFRNRSISMMTIQSRLRRLYQDGHEEGDEGPKATSSNGELKSTIMDSGVRKQ